MDEEMTLVGALIAARHRLLRPERYTRIAGVVVAFFVVEVALRFASNLYLAQVLAASAGTPDTASMSFFTRANVMWCALFLGSVSAILSYRGIAPTVGNLRLALAPVGPSRLLAAATAASLRSIPGLAPVALGLAASAAALTRASGLLAARALLVLLPGIAGFLLFIALARRLRAREGHLELIEAGLLIAMMLANPVPRLAGGRPELLLFNSWTIASPQVILLYLLPVFGTMATAGAVLVSGLVGRRREGTKRGAGPRLPVMVFYRSKIPLGLLGASYVFEISVILGNPATSATVRTIVFVILGLQLLWFLSFLFRSEQEIGEVIRAPHSPALRLAFYRPAAALHATLCAAPLLLYLAKLLLFT